METHREIPGGRVAVAGILRCFRPPHFLISPRFQSVCNSNSVFYLTTTPLYSKRNLVWVYAPSIFNIHVGNAHVGNNKCTFCSSIPVSLAECDLGRVSNGLRRGGTSM